MNSCKFSKGPDCAKNDIIELLLIVGCLFSGKTASNSFKSRFVKWNFWKMSEWGYVIVKENLTIFLWNEYILPAEGAAFFKRLFIIPPPTSRENLINLPTDVSPALCYAVYFFSFSFLIIKISFSVSTNLFRQWMLSALLLHKVAYEAFSQYPWSMRVSLSSPQIKLR